MSLVAQIAVLLAPAGIMLAPGLPASEVLERVAARRAEGELTSLTVRGTFSFQGLDAREAAAALGVAATSELSAPGVVTYKMPGRCRVEVDVDGLELAASNVRGAVKSSGPSLGSLWSFAARVCPLLAQPSTEELLAFVRARGVDTSQVSLGRIDGVAAYVLGSRPRRAGSPSFWVEKEQLDPLRLVSRDGGRVEDVLLLDYSSPLAREWHPRVVEIRRGKSLTRFSAETLEANAEVPDTLF